MPTVLVTRLMPFAGSLIKELEQNGYDVIHESLLSVEPLYYRRPELPSGRLIVTLTSRVTLEILEQRRDEILDLLSMPCYCVGDKTADDARRFGFINVISAQGNGRDLANLIIEKELFKNPILHIGGEDVSMDPRHQLKEEGWEFVHWPIYKAIETQDLSEHLLTDFELNNIDCVVLYSVRAAQIFIKLIKRYELEDCCKKLTVVGLSNAIINELNLLKFNETIAALSPTEADLIDAVSRLAPPFGDHDDIIKRHRSNG